MHRLATSRRALRIALSGALAGVLLTGCSTIGGVSAGVGGAAKAQMVQEQTIAAAEAAVLAAPLDPALRARLGTLYLTAGRFQSAAASFEAAMALGDSTPHTALRLALALTGSGRGAAAAALLFERARDIPAADLGLALALAGEVQAATRVMEAAIRDGENSAALRQNLALAYAFAGRWREARLMASLDLRGAEVGARMERWAAMAIAGQPEQRLAMLLRVPAQVRDAGLPAALAYAPAEAEFVAAAAGQVPAPLAMPARAVPALGEDRPIRALETYAVPQLAVAERAHSGEADGEETARALPRYRRRATGPAAARW